MIKVLIADDHQIVLEGLLSILGEVESIEVLGTAKNGHQVLRLFDHAIPDVLILDLEMPGMNGIDTAKYIKQEYPTVKILALSMHNEPHLIRQFLKAGADGYILKDAGKSILLEAIETIATGKSYYDEAVMRRIMDNIGSKSNAADKPQLSKREIEIIRLIADQMTSAEIAEKLHLSPLTIETHRKNILLKLGLRNAAGLIRFAFQKGWVE